MSFAAPSPNQFVPIPVRGALASSPNLNIFDVQIVEGDTNEFVPGQPVQLLADNPTPPIPPVNAIPVEKLTSQFSQVFGIIIDDTKVRLWSVASGKKEFRVAIEGSIINLSSSEIISRGDEVKVSAFDTNPTVSSSFGTGTIVGISLDRATGANQLIRVFFFKF